MLIPIHKYLKEMWCARELIIYYCGAICKSRFNLKNSIKSYRNVAFAPTHAHAHIAHILAKPSVLFRIPHMFDIRADDSFRLQTEKILFVGIYQETLY